MSDWSEGYVTGVDYTFGYYGELNPARIPLAFAFAGLAAPELRHCLELGFGQGISANIHAAASPAQWHGTDFNPSQAALARRLAAAAGSGADFSDDSFADFCARDDLPQFDYIGLHGIWSWISDANREVIVDFVRRKLAVGGVLYVSYNSQPGWAAMVPMRDLLAEHAAVMGVPGAGVVRHIDDALAFAERLMALQPAYAVANPGIVPRLAGIKAHDRHYVAHEYFNRDWMPISFAHMKAALTPAKVAFACSAHYLDNVPALNATAEQAALLESIPDASFRETVKDFIVNQGFRRDYWTRGVQRLNPLERLAALRRQRVVLIQRPEDVTLTVKGPAGEATLQESVYRPLVQALADYVPRSVGELERSLADAQIGLQQLVQAVVVFVGANVLTVAQPEAQVEAARARTDALNRHLCERAAGSAEIGYLASPVSGGGFAVPRIHQLFLLARSQGRKAPDDWARFAWQVISAQGQKMIRDGRTLETADENLAHLAEQAKGFAEKRLAILAGLGIA